MKPGSIRYLEKGLPRWFQDDFMWLCIRTVVRAAVNLNRHSDLSKVAKYRTMTATSTVFPPPHPILEEWVILGPLGWIPSEISI